MSVTSPVLNVLRERVLVFDGSMGVSLQSLELDAAAYGGPRLEGWIDGLVLHSPDAVAGVHRSFLEVGCDVVETCTFQSTRRRLAEWGEAERTHELNQAAAQLARRLCDEFSTPEQPRFVAGSIGPTGFLPSSTDPTLGNITFGELVDGFAEQSEGLLDGGVDLLIIETAQDILEVKAAVFGARTAFERHGRAVPIQTSVSLDVNGRMLLGTDIGAVLAILDGLDADIIGLNCSTGPDAMREPIRYLAENAGRPVSCIPNAGLPLNVGGATVYPLGPVPMAEQLAAFVDEFGVRIVGGCCGTTPDHLRELIARVRQPAVHA